MNHRLSELTQANGIPIDVQSSFQDGFSTIATKVCVSPTALSAKLVIDLSSNILDTPAAACALEVTNSRRVISSTFGYVANVDSAARLDC